MRFPLLEEPDLCLAQRALAAAAIFARAAGDILLLGFRVDEVSNIEAKRFSSASMCLLIPTASSNALRVRSI